MITSSVLIRVLRSFASAAGVPAPAGSCLLRGCWGHRKARAWEVSGEGYWKSRVMLAAAA